MHPDRLVPAVDAKRPLVDDLGAGPQDTGVLREIAGMLRLPMFGEIGWRADDDDAQRMQSARDQGFVGGVADADGDIEALRSEIDLFVRGPEFEVHTGIELQKTADDRRYIGRRKQDGRTDFQRPRDFAAQIGGLGPRRDDLCNRRLDALIEYPSGFGRFRSPRGAFHEFYAKRAFQRDQRSVERLQRAPKMTRGRRLAALLDNSQKGFEIVQPFQFDMSLLIYRPLGKVGRTCINCNDDVKAMPANNWHDGQITSDFQKSCQARESKIFRFGSHANQLHNSACLTADEGRSRSSRTRGEMRWTLRAR